MVSHFHAICMLQTDVSWCFLWVKDVGQSQGCFNKGVCWHLSWTINSNMQVFEYLPQSLGIDSAWGHDIFEWSVGFLYLPQGLCDDREFGRDPSSSLTRGVNKFPPLFYTQFSFSTGSCSGIV